MFDGDPKARADLKVGTLYAVAGERGWLYYGQVTSEKKVAFLRHRTRTLEVFETILSQPLMSVFSVGFPSITRALRAGGWSKLGRFAASDEITVTRPDVQWPMGTLIVTVWSGSTPSYDTRVDDPTIQDFEIAAAWDAQFHVPARLTADFGVEEAEWHVGGPIRRERRMREELARRAPDQPEHRLPPDCVWTNHS